MSEAVADLFHRMIARITHDREPATLRILDFGCGDGALARELLARGYDAYGTDIGGDWQDAAGAWVRPKPGAEWAGGDRFRPLTSSPYRLPFDDGFFDGVISNQVFEHASNKQEAFAELARVTKPNGFSIHCFPSKWRIVEPHIFVPLTSWMWPNVPRWWLGLWAFIGVRNGYQHGKHWREVAALNEDFTRKGIHYLTKRQVLDIIAAAHGRRQDWNGLRYTVSTGLKYRLLRRLPIVGPLVAHARGTMAEHWIGHAPIVSDYRD